MLRPIPVCTIYPDLLINEMDISEIGVDDAASSPPRRSISPRSDTDVPLSPGLGEPEAVTAAERESFLSTSEVFDATAEACPPTTAVNPKSRMAEAWTSREKIFLKRQGESIGIAVQVH